MIDRRTFLGTLASGLLAAPLAAEAQKSEKMARVGTLSFGPAPSPEQLAKNVSTSPFWLSMRKLGLVDGQNMVVERRFGESADQLRTGAADLVRLKVDVRCGGFSSLKHPDRDLHPALSVGPFLSGLEDAAARFDQLGHLARTVKIREEPEKKTLFFSSEIEYHMGSDGPSARLEYLNGERATCRLDAASTSSALTS